MEQHDPLIEHYRSLHPRRFSYVEKFEVFSESSEDSGTSLTLVIELLSDTFEKQNLRLSFYGVKDLQLHIALEYIQLQEIQITPMNDYQWEGLKYRVLSNDANRLAFFCRSFIAELVEERAKESFRNLKGEE